MDYSIPLEKIADTLEKVGEPLSKIQKMCMAGCLAVWLEKAYGEGVKDALKIKSKV